MGLRSRLARWLNSAATPAQSTSVAGAPTAHDWDRLVARVEKLELDRPAFVTALEEIAERCHEILDNSEAKRARVAARESRLNKRERGEEPEQPALPPTREEMKANVRQLLRAQGKIL